MLAEADSGGSAMHHHAIAGPDIDAIRHRIGVKNSLVSSRYQRRQPTSSVWPPKQAHDVVSDGESRRPKHRLVQRTERFEIDLPPGCRIGEDEPPIGPGGEMEGHRPHRCHPSGACAQNHAECRAEIHSARWRSRPACLFAALTMMDGAISPVFKTQVAFGDQCASRLHAVHAEHAAADRSQERQRHQAADADGRQPLEKYAALPPACATPPPLLRPLPGPLPRS